MTDNHWSALRKATRDPKTGEPFSQREVERRLGWTKRGHLSLIERGISPTLAQEAQLRSFYREVLLGTEGTASQAPSTDG